MTNQSNTMLLRILSPSGLLGTKLTRQPAGLLLSSSSSPSIRCLSQEHIDKQIVDKPTPYNKADRQCILCKHKIQLDYKNPRLLSQFVSPLNGKIYDKHITGLCEKQQTVLQVEIAKSRRAMFMPYYYRDPRFNKDPELVNASRPQRPNPH